MKETKCKAKTLKGNRCTSKALMQGLCIIHYTKKKYKKVNKK